MPAQFPFPFRDRPDVGPREGQDAQFDHTDSKLHLRCR